MLPLATQIQHCVGLLPITMLELEQDHRETPVKDFGQVKMQQSFREQAKSFVFRAIGKRCVYR